MRIGHLGSGRVDMSLPSLRVRSGVWWRQIGLGVRHRAELGAEVPTQVGVSNEDSDAPVGWCRPGPRRSDKGRGWRDCRCQTVAGMRSTVGAATVADSTLWAWRMPRAPSTNITPEPMKAAIAAHIAMVPRVAKA